MLCKHMACIILKLNKCKEKVRSMRAQRLMNPANRVGFTTMAGLRLNKCAESQFHTSTGSSVAGGTVCRHFSGD